MNKIILIIKREFLTRVRKRSFIVMTLLGPILMAALFIVPVYVAQIEGEVKTIGVIDDSGLFGDALTNSENIHFVSMKGSLDSAKKEMLSKDYYGLLYIPQTEISVPQTVKLYSSQQPNIVVKGYIRDNLRKKIEALKLETSGVDPGILSSIKSHVNLLTIKINKSGEEASSSTELSMGVGFVSGLIIYIFIFMYGALVMRGVIEEKTSRIVEVIISSVKPFQLMMGKITGVALVGLTQFALWVVFTLIIVSSFLSVFKADISEYESSQLKITEEFNESPVPDEQNTPLKSEIGESQVNESVVAIFDSIRSINFTAIIFMFLFYFIGGYLTYAALFAAIGSAADSETDTQQFMLPVTIPLILSIVVSQVIMYNPDGPAAFWLSIIPLTSPVIMMIRIPFGVPYTDLYLSMGLLILGFLGTTWLAGKIYRTGILMYGKKISYKELWKWVRYKN